VRWQADAIFTEGLTIALATGGIAANQLHAWAHARTAPTVIRWLQRHWLVLPPAHHARHHRGGATSAYCTTTGWMNRGADRLKIFVGLEHALCLLGVPVTGAP
jgi:plasmanylethanolamine desaturase